MDQIDKYKPGVISRQMLVDLVVEQGAKGQAGMLFVDDGINLDEITAIRIEFKNILKIDGLWMMKSLTTLKLSNNGIEKIENLDSLVNLIELDLSFNHICTIESLDNIVNLETLLLYGNEIQEVRRMDRQTRLTILSIGGNKINDREHVMYLRQFKQLRSLNVNGNACVNGEGYFDYLVAFLPQIVYLNYRMISENERKLAQEKHQRAILNLEEKEATEMADMQEKQAAAEKIAILSQSYIEHLDGNELFLEMFKLDNEGRELASINEEARGAHEEYEKIISGFSRQLYDLGLSQRDRRSEEIRSFEKVVNDGRESVHAAARALIDEIVERKVGIFDEIEVLLSNVKVDQKPEEKSDDEEKQVAEAQRLADEFNSLSSSTWNKLMHEEMILHEQIEDLNETHRVNMGDLISGFSEAARAIFSLMRDAQADYRDNIDAIATIYASTFADQNKMPARYVDICGDKDILSNTIATSHHLHLQTIDAREDVMMSRLKNWYDDYTENLARDETERHHSQILEISHFLEYQKLEFETLQFANRRDAEIIAIMEAAQ